MMVLNTKGDDVTREAISVSFHKTPRSKLDTKPDDKSKSRLRKIPSNVRPVPPGIIIIQVGPDADGMYGSVLVRRQV